ncbi:unnamed protein product [Aphanomyces euteiches]|uniref:Uncharacterized protein n=2 Tax=Aphanomyces euteiches TaxID=100861 RepID=A0A6G0XIP2_9STRA|nr:hypothetical protein Ae201684_004359 [Aphanomyces euteiches]KAH9093857.1 hypothetical protein Ae201684P_016479 [Aphanomyces euteiches]KAH9136265.1 hypothetical protein AeRB84_018486 [Aphanomyces euteiches]
MNQMPMAGMIFADSKQALHFVQDYALQTGKQVKVMAKSGGGHKRMICSCATCPFFVQMYQQKKIADDQKVRQWYISSCDLNHAIHCTSVPKPTCRQLIEMQSLQAAVQANSKISANALISSMPSLNLKRLQRTVYRAKREILTRNPDEVPDETDKLHTASVDAFLMPSKPPSVNMLPPPPTAPVSTKKRKDDKEWLEIERVRLEIKRRKEERLAKEAQVNYRILVAKAQEAELALKVARAKARQELLNAGISLGEVEHILL